MHYPTSFDSDELLDLPTLRRRLDEDGPMSVQEVSHLLDRLAELIDTAHSQGTVLGRIAAEDILLLPDGRIRLLGAKSVTEGMRRPHRHSPHALVPGTQDAATPEEARGEEPSASTDIWLLGALLYETLSGHPPFAGLHRCALLDQVANADPQDLPDSAACVQLVLDRALSKWPANRYLSAQALANAFWVSLPHPDPAECEALQQPVPAVESSTVCMPAAGVAPTQQAMLLRHAAGRPLRLSGAYQHMHGRADAADPLREKTGAHHRLLRFVRRLQPFAAPADAAAA